MKKVFVIVTLILWITVGVACSGGESAEPTQTPPPTATLPLPTEEPTTLPEPTAEPTIEAAVEPTQSSQSTSTLPVWSHDQFGYGIQSHAVIGDPAYAMTVIHDQLGLQWVKVQMRWAELQPSATDGIQWGIWDSVVQEANKKGLYLMLSIVTAPEWTRGVNDPHGPPNDYGLYNLFLTEVLTRYAGKVHAIEVWNEQNLDREWRTDQGVDPSNYVRLLQGAYETIKQIDPNVIVISGALAPTGVHDAEKKTVYNDFIWTDEALALGMLTYVDCVGVHHNGYNLPPDIGYDEVEKVGTADEVEFTGPWLNPHPSWSFKTTIDTMAEKVRAIDPTKKLCVTEFGWASSEGYDETPVGFEFAVDNSLDDQAKYIVQAYQEMQQSGNVMLAFLFNLDFGNKGGGPTDDPVPYSILDTNGAPRPAFSSISAMEKVR